ncbi:Uncharacterised protein [Vibrio cholerae]|nr:Uncharacterised protein [Vibrio cholerae]
MRLSPSFLLNKPGLWLESTGQSDKIISNLCWANCSNSISWVDSKQRR